MQDRPKIETLPGNLNWRVSTDTGAQTPNLNKEFFGGRDVAVSNPLDESKVQVVGDFRGQLDVNGMTSAETEFGKGFEVSLNFENADEAAFFEDLDPAVTQALKIVTELRLKSVSSDKGLNPVDEARLGEYNKFISSVYSMRDRMARSEQLAMEARAQELILEAEALLYLDNQSDDLESAYKKVDEIVHKLGSRASVAIQTKLAELKGAMEAKRLKSESKKQI